MTQSSPPETGLIEKAMKKVDEGKKPEDAKKS